MEVDEVFKNISGDLSYLREALELLEKAQVAENLTNFNAIFGTFGSTLFHVTEKVEKFCGVTDRWDFINCNPAVSLCYEMGTRYKHGTLDQRYLRRREALMDEVLASAPGFYTIAEPWEVIDVKRGSEIAVPEAVRKPKTFFKYIALDNTRHRASELAQQALSALEKWLAIHGISSR